MSFTSKRWIVLLAGSTVLFFIGHDPDSANFLLGLCILSYIAEECHGSIRVQQGEQPKKE